MNQCKYKIVWLYSYLIILLFVLPGEYRQIQQVREFEFYKLATPLVWSEGSWGGGIGGIWEGGRGVLGLEVYEGGLRVYKGV